MSIPISPEYTNGKSGLTITVPAGAVCGLYPQAPTALNYFKAIDPQNALPATCVTTADGIATYYYDQLPPGLYHCGVSMDGCNAVCRMILYTAEKAAAGLQLDITPDRLAGNGYEAGYFMLNTPEFIAAQLASEKDTWGPAYARLFRTPQFLRDAEYVGRHQQTTNEEMMDFIARLAATNQNMHIYSLGTSPKYGYDMPLVLFTREDVSGKTLEQAARIIRGNSKPTIQYTAQCHSAEPASTEGALAMMLELCGDYGARVLDEVDIYMIPRINLDGAYEAVRVAPATGEDLNRDYLRMYNKEVCMVTSAYNLFLPEVAIDGHEKMPYVMATETATCTDLEVQACAGALNHSPIMMETARKIAFSALAKGRDLGLRTHFYAKFASPAGGIAGSSYFGTRNSLSFLVETPGQVHLGMHFMERRVLAQYVFTSAVIDYTVAHAQEIRDIVHASREKMIQTGAIYDENNMIVVDHVKEETGYWPLPLIDVPSGNVIDPACPHAYTEHTIAGRTRPRPTAYLLPQGLANEEEILRVAGCHGLTHYRLPAGSVVQLRQYIRNGEEIGLMQEAPQCFEQGAYVFPNTVASTILGTIMEPDFNQSTGKKVTLFSMELVEADAENRLPVFRYCHDLTDGKVLATR